MSFQAYLDTIERQIGLDAEGLKVAADAKGLSEAGRLKPGVKAGQVVDWLKPSTAWAAATQWRFTPCFPASANPEVCCLGGRGAS